jgi:hypothetical protein
MTQVYNNLIEQNSSAIICRDEGIFLSKTALHKIEPCQFSGVTAPLHLALSEETGNTRR